MAINRPFGQWQLKLQSDRELFERIREALPAAGSMSFIREHDFSQAVPYKVILEITNFYDQRRRPDLVFVDKKLEELRQQLVKDIERFIEVSAQHVFREGDFYRIFPDPDDSPAFLHSIQHSDNLEQRVHERRVLRHKVINDMNAQADKICATYDELIRSGRKKLGV